MSCLVLCMTEFKGYRLDNNNINDNNDNYYYKVYNFNYLLYIY